MSPERPKVRMVLTLAVAVAGFSSCGMHVAANSSITASETTAVSSETVSTTASVTPTSTRSPGRPPAPRATPPARCVPGHGDTVTEEGAEPEFRTFVQAIRSGDQSCADALTSPFMKQQQLMMMPKAKGKWVNFRPTLGPGMTVPSPHDRLAPLPLSTDNSRFQHEAYTRAVLIEPGQQVPMTDPPNQPRGITLHFPTSKYQINVSFIAQGGEVLVDDFSMEPNAMVTATTTG